MLYLDVMERHAFFKTMTRYFMNKGVREYVCNRQ
jgi:hypothetical protein